jgi:glycosyltransferase involved in cell wall biosynthesis
MEHPGIIDACAKLESQLDVKAYHDPNPADVLSTSKVFLSVQQTTNYPSKSLLEALACGNLPIVTDVKDSRTIAPDDFSFYVPKDFAARDLAEQAVRILRMPEAVFMEKVTMAREHLKERFSVETMASYYLELYRLAGA